MRIEEVLIKDKKLTNRASIYFLNSLIDTVQKNSVCFERTYRIFLRIIYIEVKNFFCDKLV